MFFFSLFRFTFFQHLVSQHQAFSQLISKNYENYESILEQSETGLIKNKFNFILFLDFGNSILYSKTMQTNDFSSSQCKNKFYF